jgi:hypothetical protein
MDETRTVSKIWWWASQRRKGWNHEVNKTRNFEYPKRSVWFNF